MMSLKICFKKEDSKNFVEGHRNYITDCRSLSGDGFSFIYDLTQYMLKKLFL